MLPHLLFPLVASFCAVIYLYFINREISRSRSLFKTLPVVILAASTLGLGQPFLGLALSFSALGDLFLSRKKEDWFIAGLIAFLVGHLFYIILFWQSVRFASPNWIVIGVLILYSVSFGAVLIKKAEKYRLPIVAYITILSTMGILAVHLPANHVYVTAGAMVFIVSDSILALRMFVVKDQTVKDKLSYGVWCTYILAQFLILYGFILTLPPVV